MRDNLSMSLLCVRTYVPMRVCACVRESVSPCVPASLREDIML